MNFFAKRIRNKRYAVKSGAAVQVILETATATTLNFEMIDCSQTGIHVRSVDKSIDRDCLQADGLIPTSKITWDGKEAYLGRLVVRRMEEKHDCFHFAFSTVDSPVPIAGPLSHKLEVILDAEEFNSDKELSSDKFNLAHFVESEFSNVDLFDRVRQFAYFHAEWEKSKKYSYENYRMHSKGPRVNLKRIRKNGRSDYLVMASNDYLGLGAHPDVIQAAKLAMDTYGFGSTGSPVTTGLSEPHYQLCEKLAQIHQKESALLFNSGYAANVGIISSLCANGDLVVADQLCHASIQDGMAMCRGTSRYFRHNDETHLRAILEKERANFNGCLVITEGVFSMDGDVAKLDRIFQVAREFNCRIMVDQAHCWGVVGPNGLGVCDKYNLFREVDIIMGTFSKMAGGIGGFVVGSSELTDWIRFFARSQMFSVSMSPSTAAGVLKSIEVFLNDKSHLENLRRNIKHFVKGLESIGYMPAHDQESAIIPVFIGDETKLGEMNQSLLEDGIWTIPIVYPAVSRKNSRFRLTMMANHTTSDLDYAVLCLEKAALKCGFSFQDSTKKRRTAA